MGQITLQYIPFNTDTAFLRIKQPVIGLTHYRLAFFVHVYTSMFVLLAGATQFSSSLREHQPQWHRRFGWLYVVTIVVFAAPSGLVMGWYANGGLSSQIGFCLLSVAWFYTTTKAVLTARQLNWSAHRAWMIRSFALTLSAITLRAWKFILVALLHPRPMDVYRTVAWLSWLGNLVIAEIIIYQMKKK
ncbi:MAG: DUF2306 domain-containing protein [Tunicatimonas sp.]